MAGSLMAIRSSLSSAFSMPTSCSCNGVRDSSSCNATVSSRHSQFLHHKQLFCHSPLSKQFSLPVLLRRFSVKSMQISGPGSVDSALIASMHAKLKDQLKAEEVIVKDAYGDGRHVSIDVVSSEFEGKSSMNRQRMVYKAIWEEMQSTVHAVDNMRTRTPAEAAQEK